MSKDNYVYVVTSVYYKHGDHDTQTFNSLDDLAKFVNDVEDDNDEELNAYHKAIRVNKITSKNIDLEKIIDAGNKIIEDQLGYGIVCIVKTKDVKVYH